MMDPKLLTAPLPYGDEWIDVILLAYRLTIGVRTAWRFTASGRLPQPVRFTRKLVRWRWLDVVAHLEEYQRRQEAQDATDVGIEESFATALTL